MNNRLRRALSLLLACSLALSLALPALAGEGGEDAGLQVTLDPGRLELQLGAAEQGTLTARVSGAAEGEPTAFTWSTDDASVVQVVEEDGGASASVTALAPGQTRSTVTADAGGKSGSAACDVVVQHAAAASLTLTPAGVTLDAGEERQVGVSVSPSGADATDVTWKSSSERVVTVSPAAGDIVTLTARAPGEAAVTATAGSGVSAVCTVTVPGVTLSDSSATLLSGNTQTLTASLFGGIGSAVEWSSSNEVVAQVSYGVVSARNEGTAVITATAAGTSYSASCTVTVRENTAGILDGGSAAAGQPLQFSSLASDLNRQCRSALGAGLSYITGLSVPTQAGVLYYGYVSESDTGAGVGTTERYYYSGGGSGVRQLENVCFVPSGDYTGSTADISYTGYTSDARFFRGTIRVEITRSSAITYSTSGKSPVLFQASDFNNVCRDRNGRDLDYVTFSLPTASKGTLYYNYTGSSLDAKVSDATAYYRSGSPGLGQISFVPAQDSAGSVTIQYTAYDTRGNSFSGRVVINLSQGGGSGDISYSTAKGRAVSFTASAFNTLCRDLTGSSLDRVRFDLPSTSRGTLYYGYKSSGSYDAKVSASKSYYRSSSPYLSQVSFVPASGFTGTVEIAFTAWSDDGDRFTGTVSVKVGSGSGSGRELSYSTARDRALELDAGDFNDLCRDETGYALDRVRFDLPAASRGTLYYGYKNSASYDAKVSESKSYYRASSPYLSDVTFVPASGYTGTVEIGFTAWSTDGDKFTGTLSIQVGSGTGSGRALSYSTARNRALELDSGDFNDFCRDETGAALDRVRFELPAASRGTLYYGYKSSGSYDAKVSESKSYYRSSSPYLSDVTFVPASGYTGTVEIPFTAWDVDGGRCEGVLKIAVGGRADARVSCSVTSGRVLTLDDGDFNTLSRDETGAALRCLRFDALPPSSQGVLYYDYTSAEQYDGKVSASKRYYRASSPYLNRVAFVPAAGYTGTAEIAFTAWDADGEEFSGTLEITVKPAPAAGVISYSTGGGRVQLQLSDFQNACAARQEGAFVSAVFTLPASQAGRLYYNYTGPSQYDSTVTPSLSYRASGTPSLALVSFVPRAGYAGTVTIPYTAVDSDGASYSALVQITVTPPASSSHFSDMGGYAWAAASVDYLYENGVISGAFAGRYLPGSDITRGDFILMLTRARDQSAQGGAGFPDVPAGSYCAAAVETAQVLGITQGDGGNFYPGRSLTRQEAALFLYRAMRADGWSLPDGSHASLAAFPDGGGVAEYAAPAMAAMVEQGVLKGDGAGRLNPGGTLSRAETAVILHRALTL